MAQHHLDPLPDPGLPRLHLCVVATFAGPPPPFADLLAHVRSRLRLVPRYRQKLVAAPGGLGPLRWADDPSFNLEYHVRHTAVPDGAGRERRRAQLGRVVAQALDPTKPPWELWVVEGRDGGPWSLVAKDHPALADGGLDLLTVLPDLEPARRPAHEDPWVPHPEPSPAQLVALALSDAARRAAELPLRTAELPLRAAGSLRAAVARRLDPAPPSPLNVPVGPHRRVASAELPLAELKEVKDRAGGTVNDLVLALTAGAVRAWMHERGLPTGGVELRAAVPVATERDGLTEVVAPLPIGEPDPLARLRRVSGAMAGLKERHGALGADLIAAQGDFQPPTILARALRLPVDPSRANLLVANVPGPQRPLHLLGRRMEAVWPIAPLTGDRALAVAAMSYAGTVHVGLTGDLDVLGDLDVVAEALPRGLAELRAATEPGRRPPGGRRRPSRRR